MNDYDAAQQVFARLREAELTVSLKAKGGEWRVTIEPDSITSSDHLRLIADLADRADWAVIGGMFGIDLVRAE